MLLQEINNFKMSNKMRIHYLFFLLIPFQSFGQWNYDNQNVIYSTNGKIGIGIGSVNPNANLQLGDETENGLMNLGGYSFIGSLRSSGDFFAGMNAYSEYSSSAENSKIKVYNTNSDGFSAMQMCHNGDINFYVKGGSVTANDQVNIPDFNAFKISRSGFVGIGTTNPLGYLHINPFRPVVIKNNGGQGVYGSEIGFNSILDTSVTPNKFKKLGGTSQRGAANVSVDYYGNMFFQMYDGGSEAEVAIDYQPQIAFLNNGNVGIGTMDSKGYKLAIAGSAVAEEVVVKLQSGWPDYVFKNDYKLSSLSETEQFINTNKRLPDVPSADNVKENGLNLGEMNAILLKKVEELTLYLIEQNKNNEVLKQQVEKLQIEMISLKKQNVKSATGK